MNTNSLVPFTMTVAGQEQLDFRLGVLRDNVTNLTDLWPDVDELLREMEKEQFWTQGNRGGEGWVKLSTEYRIWKERNYPGQPILVRTGELRKSLTEKGGHHIFTAGRMGMTFGTFVPYALPHQTGGGNLPARPPIKLLKKEDAVKVGKLMQEFLWKSGQGQRRVTL